MDIIINMMFGFILGVTSTFIFIIEMGKSLQRKQREGKR